ncbi:Uncharacterized conserved protein [Phaffia rhodozyma]|uniref:Uncharacterized conserved protein n=1 Tax=Phaffia rhodozyma TaxID=264483 RepID=A0A0F7SLE7_PHARH|nr:Uncharacterized conserved protein [Phaffia rhodozyma]
MNNQFLSNTISSLSRTSSPAPPSHVSATGVTSSNSSIPPLSLKVMRLSQPSLSPSAQPPLSHQLPPTILSDALLGRSRQNLLNAGNGPVLGEFVKIESGLSTLLTLPSSFGSISLGETFCSLIAISNPTTGPVARVRLRVEIHSVSAKVVLADITGKDEEGGGVDPGCALSKKVEWEIKELGQHGLVCEVFWEDDQGEERSFRKVYKFQAINPLSVKTKVHFPNSSTTAQLSPSLQKTIFLELHIQNTSPLPMYFPRMKFEPVDGLTFRSMNNLGKYGQAIEIQSEDEDSSTIWDEGGQGSLLIPGNIRQICWIVDESGRSSQGEPGGVLPLGRLDIFWTTPYGETGHLQTATLNRRVPIAPLPRLTPAQTPSQPTIPLPSMIPVPSLNSFANPGGKSSLPIQQLHRNPPSFARSDSGSSFVTLTGAGINAGIRLSSLGMTAGSGGGGKLESWQDRVAGRSVLSPGGTGSPLVSPRKRDWDRGDPFDRTNEANEDHGDEDAGDTNQAEGEDDDDNGDEEEEVEGEWKVESTIIRAPKPGQIKVERILQLEIRLELSFTPSQDDRLAGGGGGGKKEHTFRFVSIPVDPSLQASIDSKETLRPLGPSVQTFGLNPSPASTKTTEEAPSVEPTSSNSQTKTITLQYVPTRPGLVFLGGYRLVRAPSLSKKKGGHSVMAGTESVVGEKEIARWAGLGDIWVSR